MTKTSHKGVDVLCHLSAAYLNDINLPLWAKKRGFDLLDSLSIYLFGILNSKLGYHRCQFGPVNFLLLSCLPVSKAIKENPLFFSHTLQRKAEWNLLNRGWWEGTRLLTDIQFPDMPTFARDWIWLCNNVHTEKFNSAYATILIETVT